MTPERTWWSAAEIAAANLPDLPGTKQGVNALADRHSWQADRERARRREARGGGWEYHWTLFPARAQAALAQRATAPEVAVVPEAPQPTREDVWARFEALPEKPRQEARRRLAVLQKVDLLERGGASRNLAVRDVAELEGIGARTIWSWFDLVSGVRLDDRLAFLAPRHREASRTSRRTEIDPEFGQLIKDDWLRQAQPSLASVHERCVRIAEVRGIEVAPLHTVRRWLDRTVSEPTRVLRRKGPDALRQLYPAQVRDKTAMQAMEAVNGDFHRFDVFVRWPAAAGQREMIVRPQMVAFQDIYSGRLLAWRVDQTANSHAVQLCIGDMIEDWGIPEHVLLDNGREFAAAAITGGAPTRYRWKVTEDDIPGLLVSLGCEIHWARPYSGQSKPIERAFRDLCDRVAKHPSFEGAWTGNRPDAKPENYGSAAVPLDRFLEVLATEIEAHNLRRGRRSEVAWGRSFAEVFDESYAVAPIRKATAEQRRLWLMGVEGVKANARNGQVTLLENVYWSDWMHRIAGRKIVARFDKSALWDGVHIYDLSGAYLGHAACMKRGPFFDVDDARTLERAKAAWLRKERDAAAAHQRYTAAELGDAHAALPPTTPPVAPDAKVVRPVFAQAARPAVAPVRPVTDPDTRQAEDAVIADLAVRLPAARAAREEEKEIDRFRRAVELEAAIEAGRPATKEQRVWLATYQTSDEYRGQARLYRTHGTAFLAEARGTGEESSSA